MGFFQTVGENIRDGVAWGAKKTLSAANAVGSATVDAGKAVGHAAVSTVNAVGNAAVSTGKAVGHAAKAGIGMGTVAAAKGGAWALTANEKVEKWVQTKIDKRKLYQLKEPCTPCGKSNPTSHPNPNDGKFMGKDCPNAPLSDKPPQGRLPDGCGPDCGLPKIYLTNGINNSEEVVCNTITQLAESRCAEVVAIYNATYNDKKKLSGPGSGMVQDVLDCKDNIDRAGTEAAADTQTKMLYENLSAEPPKKVTLYAHSQGGLITQRGLLQARRKLYNKQYKQMIAVKYSNDDAKKAANLYADERMKDVEVYSFGTAEQGWPDGPSYHQFTNSRDPVPALIKTVQEKHGNSINNDPTTLVNRHRFAASPSFDPFDAHGMPETYIPELDKLDKYQPTPKKANGKCC